MEVTNRVRGYRRENADPPYLHPDYKATQIRAPAQPLIPLAHTLSEVTGPVYGDRPVGELDNDLTRQHGGEPIGERMILHGRVLDGDGRPVRGTLVEVWQANSAGRYRFTTIKPGAYPWGNHPNAWRAAHIHISLFGPAFVTRLVTQMYFPGDPLFFQDPIFHSVPDPRDRERMVCGFDLDNTVEEWALAYKFDIVLRGRDATPSE